MLLHRRAGRVENYVFFYLLPVFFFLQLPREALGFLVRRNGKRAWRLLQLTGQHTLHELTWNTPCSPHPGTCTTLSIAPSIAPGRSIGRKATTHTNGPRRATQAGVGRDTERGVNGQEEGGCRERNPSHSLFVLWESVWSREPGSRRQGQEETES